MKKQFLFLATTFVTIAFISCSKEKVETQPASQDIEEQVTSSNSPAERLVINPLLVNLEGRYDFNNNLKDATRKLVDGKASPNLRGIPIYTYDRKGIANAALKFDGNYYVSIENVPVQQNMSLSVWVKRTTVYGSSSAPAIIRHNSTGLSLLQDENAMWARVLCYTTSESSSITSSPFYDQGWHHFVITYSNDRLKIYVDGQLQGQTSNVFTITDVITKYLLGYAHGNAGNYWKGSIDDLRFYSRTLSASDVTALYNL